ncbi:FAD-dependent thymidylate synthase [Synechococcus elongatus]|uniref:FAD-dependent thymidylate synthase n=1 Tax=Synechococcus elongatus TaxID=32046 RepID=UPI001EDF4CA8|nr:FAD-dependent thymidylate synthase [Synechococcus elongatus]
MLRSTPNPQQLIWLAMKQDYSEKAIVDCLDRCPVESEAGLAAIKSLLASGQGHYGCYSSDTEVLTRSGWKFWEFVTPDDRLAAVDVQSGLIHFEKPVALQRKRFQEGDRLYAINSQRLDLAVTLDHRMPVSSRGKHGWSDWRFEPAQSVIGKAVRYQVAGVLKDEERGIPADVPSGVDLIQLFKLAGFFFGDGLRTESKKPSCVRFKLRRIRKIRYLHTLGFEVQANKGDRYTIAQDEVARWIHKNFSSPLRKKLPDFIISLPVILFEALLDGLKNSDGTITGNSWALDSSEKEALDLLQAAAHLNNKSASLTLNNPNEGEGHENHRPCWRLNFTCHPTTARFELSQKNRTRGSERLEDYQGFVYCATVSTGALMVRRNNKPVVSGNCLEHPQITFNCCGYPHSVIQQGRTHRIGTSWDVQSMRYTSKRFLDVLQEIEGKPVIGDAVMQLIESVFYLRPKGEYTDRKGSKYSYTELQRQEDLGFLWANLEWYAKRIEKYGFSEEHARGLLPFDYRQHFVVSFNMRSLMHFLDLRAKKDAQLEIQALCHQMMARFRQWAPELAAWYEENRWLKGRLAP